MIKIKIILPDGREIPARIRERTYKKLTAKIKKLSFWERLKLLFKGD